MENSDGTSRAYFDANVSVHDLVEFFWPVVSGGGRGGAMGDGYSATLRRSCTPPHLPHTRSRWTSSFPVAHCTDPLAVRRLRLPPLLLVNASSDAGLGAHTDAGQAQLLAANAAGRARRRNGSGLGTLRVR
jgi:hypothetical protein